MKKTTIFALAIIIISFAVSIYLYPQMPDRMASHWNSQGEVDGYMSRFWGLFLMPIVVTFCFLLFIFLPRIDPLKKNVEKFRKYYDWFIALFIAFMFYVYLLTIFWNLDYRFNMTVMIIPAFGILIYYIGILVENCKRNWFIGIKTPWTLSSDEVWNKTHKLAAKLFKAAGVIALSGLFLQKYAIWIFLVPVLFAAFYPIFYSYFEYKKIKKHNSGTK
ncbi:SdpI family protein [Candidatus Woesearchaeota archaeon]|nr:SdpI family protein [Candidatus Woesearchaeota archaeon]